MARRGVINERQVDIFGAVTVPPAPKPPSVPLPAFVPAASAAPAPISPPLPSLARSNASPASEKRDPPAEIGADALAARLSRAELDELARALPDAALAYLTLSVVRQLRRRLVRAVGHGRNSAKGRPSALERAAQQLAAELDGPEGDDYD